MSIKENLKTFLERINISGRQLSSELGMSDSWWGTATDAAITKIISDVKLIFPLMNEDFILSGEGSPVLDDKKNLADYSWQEYYELLVVSCIEKNISLAHRVALLDDAHDIFNKYDLIENIPVSYRRNLAGITKRMDALSGYNPENNWYLFGSNQRRPDYVNGMSKDFSNSPINADDQKLIDMRDAIDLFATTGEISKSRFERYYMRYRNLWNDPISTASRLLAIKRPDSFICVNGANKDGIKEWFKLDSDPTWDSYWEDIVEKTREMRWYKEAQSAKPRSSFEAKCMKYRVALLDCITCTVKD